MHALFDRTQATNHWSIKSGYLKEFIDYFGPRTEQLDFYYENDQITFTSFTEKIVNANKGLVL
jgi:cell cycle checkpoint control protein RAD9A